MVDDGLYIVFTVAAVSCHTQTSKLVKWYTANMFVYVNFLKTNLFIFERERQRGPPSADSLHE